MPEIPVRVPVAKSAPAGEGIATKAADETITILIEAEEPRVSTAGGDGFRSVSPAESLAKRLVDGALPFEHVSTAAKAVAGQLASAFEGLPNKPDKVTVDFGIKLTGDANILIAKGSGEANLKLTLQWGA